MKRCRNCGNEQAEGKFCGACGSPLEEVQDKEEQTTESKDATFSEGSTSTNTEEQGEAEAEQAATVEPEVTEEDKEKTKTEIINEETAEEIKEQVQHYWNFFLHLLKNPTRAFALEEKDFKYALTNFVLTAITFALAITFIMSNSFRGDYIDVPYVKIFLVTAIFMALLYGTVIVGTFVIKKLTLKDVSFNRTLIQLGGLITPIIPWQLFVIILILIDINFISILLLMLGTSIGFSYLPAFYTFERAKEHPAGQKVYIAIGTIFINSFLVYVVFRITIILFIEEIFDNFMDFFTYYLF